MNAYIYQADLLCDDCGSGLREQLKKRGKAPSDPDDEESYDSDDYPKGPYAAGGGEADTPQHCGECGVFLENALTKDGVDYVRETIDRFLESGTGDEKTLREWAKFYGLPWDVDSDDEDPEAEDNPEDEDEEGDDEDDEDEETNVCYKCQEAFPFVDMVTDRDYWYCRDCYDETYPRRNPSGIRSYGPGKFKTLLDSWVSDATRDDMEDTVSGLPEGWFGMARFKEGELLSFTQDYLEELDKAEKLTKEEEKALKDSVGILIQEDDRGFVGITYYQDEGELDDAWQKIRDAADEMDEADQA